MLLLKNVLSALAGVDQWAKCQPANQKVFLVRFPVEAQAWLAGQGPTWAMFLSPIDVPLPLFLLPLSLKKKIQSFKKKCPVSSDWKAGREKAEVGGR